MKVIRAADIALLASADEEPLLGEVLEFMRLLWAVAHGMQSISTQMKSSLGVTGRQRLVLRLVGQFPGITATRLARLLHLHPSTLTGVVKRLVKRGYLDRQEDALDARRACLRLTEAGRVLDFPTTSTVEAAVQRLLLRVPEAQRLAAQELLTALAEDLLIREAPSMPREPTFLGVGAGEPAGAGGAPASAFCEPMSRSALGLVGAPATGPSTPRGGCGKPSHPARQGR